MKSYTETAARGNRNIEIFQNHIQIMVVRSIEAKGEVPEQFKRFFELAYDAQIKDLWTHGVAGEQAGSIARAVAVADTITNPANLDLALEDEELAGWVMDQQGGRRFLELRQEWRTLTGVKREAEDALMEEEQMHKRHKEEDNCCRVFESRAQLEAIIEKLDQVEGELLNAAQACKADIARKYDMLYPAVESVFHSYAPTSQDPVHELDLDDNTTKEER